MRRYLALGAVWALTAVATVCATVALYGGHAAAVVSGLVVAGALAGGAANCASLGLVGDQPRLSWLRVALATLSASAPPIAFFSALASSAPGHDELLAILSIAVLLALTAAAIAEWLIIRPGAFASQNAT